MGGHRGPGRGCLPRRPAGFPGAEGRGCCQVDVSPASGRLLQSMAVGSRDAGACADGAAPAPAGLQGRAEPWGGREPTWTAELPGPLMSGKRVRMAPGVGCEGRGAAAGASLEAGSPVAVPHTATGWVCFPSRPAVHTESRPDTVLRVWRVFRTGAKSGLLWEAWEC